MQKSVPSIGVLANNDSTSFDTFSSSSSKAGIEDNMLGNV